MHFRFIDSCFKKGFTCQIFPQEEKFVEPCGLSQNSTSFIIVIIIAQTSMKLNRNQIL